MLEISILLNISMLVFFAKKEKRSNLNQVVEGYILYRKITHYKISLNLPDHKPFYSNQIANKRT